MRANYNMTGAERRELVHAIEGITGERAVYKFMPTCAYEIGNITVDKDGGVSCEDEEELNKVMAALGEKGFYPETEPDTEQAAEVETTEENMEPEAEVTQEEPIETETSEEEVTEATPEVEEETPCEEEVTEEQDAEETTEEADTLAEDMGTPALTISMPLNSANVGTLTNILSAKGDLIRHALGVTDIRINVTEDKIEFPWFDRELTSDETNACMLFITKLCELSKELKHASSRPVETDNEKYAFRCFLLRLGFIGPDYKEARKLLLKNLTGSSAFRSGVPKKETEEQE